MNNDRLMHSISVASKMIEIGKEYNLKKEDLHDLFLLGYLHDIGYEFINDNNFNHNEVGANILKKTNFKYYNEVYYHGVLQDEFSSLFLDILNKADMQVDKYGNIVGYDKRLEDIKERYGIDSNVYKNCKELVERLKEKGI